MKPEEIEEALDLAEGELIERLRSDVKRGKIADHTLVKIVEVLARKKPEEDDEAEDAETVLDLSGLPKERAAEIRKKMMGSPGTIAAPPDRPIPM